MHASEREPLLQLLQQLTQAQAGPQDAEAQVLIANAMARQPDAAYLLVQRCMLQDRALQAAQAQIANLQAALDRAGVPAGGHFLDSSAWGRAPAVPSFPPVPAAAPAATGFQVPGFLGRMASTAAGVAAGAFLFQGIESWMGHHGSGGHSGGNSAAAFGLSEPVAAFPPLDGSLLQNPQESDTVDAFGNGDGLDIGGDGANDWA